MGLPNERRLAQLELAARSKWWVHFEASDLVSAQKRAIGEWRETVGRG